MKKFLVDDFPDTLYNDQSLFYMKPFGVKDDKYRNSNRDDFSG
jgi:hypothetical protein